MIYKVTLYYPIQKKKTDHLSFELGTRIWNDIFIYPAGSFKVVGPTEIEFNYPVQIGSGTVEKNLLHSKTASLSNSMSWQ